MEIVPDAEDGGYVVSFPDLPGCLTVGDTIEEALSIHSADRITARLPNCLKIFINCARGTFSL
ncbi:MAG: type II toxin-antitoxin system HicB family antitoxin [Parasporobacterium sp.]|nr:type II toxin-antitoxin system HicB family antitoxin [Parasporobacterium sp.]